MAKKRRPPKSPSSPSPPNVSSSPFSPPSTVKAPASECSPPQTNPSSVDVQDPVAADASSTPGPSGAMKKKGTPFLLDSGEICVKIPNDVISRNQKRWESFVLGQFHENLPSKGALYAISNGIWSRKFRDITVSKLGPKAVLIRIPCPATRRRVLGQAMWSIEGQSMFVAAWEPGLTPTMPALTSVPVWLEFRGVPPHFFSEEGFEHVAGALGHPLHLHPSTANMTNLECGKVLTIINPLVPIPEVMNVQFDSGETHRVEVSCPWLPPICDHCRKVGHSIRRCPEAPITCSICKSTAHVDEKCPQAKGKEQKAVEEEVIKNASDLKASSSRRKNPSRRKKDKKRELASLQAAKGIVIHPPSNEEIVVKHRKSKKSLKHELTSPADKYLLKGKQVAITSSDSSSSSDNEEPDPEPEEESSSSNSESEEDDNPADDTRFMETKPLFGSIIETRVKENKSVRYFHSTFPGWSFVSNYEFAELGRIWVGWDPSVSLTVFFKSSQIITCVIQLPHTTSEVCISYIYGVNTKEGRQQMWFDLQSLSVNPAISFLPWAVMGDFNQILSPSEKSNGGSRITSGMQDFRDCVDSAGLFDLSIRGNSFTWWNHQEANPIAKKLDRIPINDSWQIKYPLSFAHFGEPDFSDHCPAVIVIGDSQPSKKPFMFSHFLLNHPEFLPRVAVHWHESSVPRSAMYAISKKLKSLKRVIKDINREYFSDLELRVKDAHSLLIDCQNRFLASPSPLLASEEKQAYNRWFSLAFAEEKFLLQKSRVKWIESGDGNTAFFHRMVAARHSANQIHYLVTGEGTKLNDMTEVKDYCVSYFTDLFGGISQPLTDSDRAEIRGFTTFRCNTDEKKTLQAPVSAENVKKEVFSLPRNKTPGPDGFTGEFYRSTWDIIDDDLVKAVQEFFNSGKLLKQWNCTAISLIPKKVGAEKLVDFRPISLCNMVYKVISKILARRLQAITPGMVSNSQSAFVKGRLLVENVLLATEMVHGFGKSNASKRGLLKVDLRKAFDSVNWGFIIEILRAADFPPVFILWIEECISTTTFSINVNGELCGFFKGTRGLRQGDLLSPSLFVIAMEAYSNLLNASFESGRIGYHPLGRNPKISHLAFADDIIILFDGTANSLQGISSSLDHFQRLSGLSINKDKTDLLTAGLNPDEAESLNMFGFRSGSLPIRYLGLPLLHRKLRKADYSPLTDKIAAKFNGWTVRALSFAGRLQLITSVIYSLVNFWCSAFSLPKGCLKDIEKLCSRFLWSGSIEEKVMAKVAWKHICLPKKEGGLGLRDFSVWNQVLNLRLIWILFTKTDSLWVAWLREHKLKRSCFWSYESRPNDSWIWKFLLSLRPLAFNFLRCKLGNGRSVSFWFDNWSDFGPLFQFVGTQGPRWMGIPVESSVKDALAMRDWSMHSRSRKQPVLQVRELLRLSTVTSSNNRDIFLWGPSADASPQFSTKKTWDWIRQSASIKPWFKTVWLKLGIPKHSFTFWVATLIACLSRKDSLDGG
ncbi:uncharacterized protein LOC112081968 [Eutrema salsugineum]|uniref:uncharacterized protein LOC112081968 n=1 Tax=Eutrema salsugineum TaxID=72664 RepID=UPI000CED3C99|nr:uncharacterized protein LOC112081968 [Eutrema salsugineum]